MSFDPTRSRGAALALAALAYFVMFPRDLTALLSPFEELFRLSQSLATGVYVVLGLLVVAWAVDRVWGPRRAPGERPPAG